MRSLTLLAVALAGAFTLTVHANPEALVAADESPAAYDLPPVPFSPLPIAFQPADTADPFAVAASNAVPVNPANQSGPQAAPALCWRENYAAARREATSTGKPLLLFITADDCLPCARQAAETFADAGIVRAVNDGFVPVKVHKPVGGLAQDRTAPAALYGYPTPTTVIASAGGTVLCKRIGFQDPAGLRVAMRAVACPGGCSCKCAGGECKCATSGACSPNCPCVAPGAKPTAVPVRRASPRAIGQSQPMPGYVMGPMPTFGCTAGG